MGQVLDMPPQPLGPLLYENDYEQTQCSSITPVIITNLKVAQMIQA